MGFNYFLPGKIRFGSGKLAELAEAVTPCGRRVLLEGAGLAVAVYDEAQPNPNTEIVSAAAAGKKTDCDLVLGVGGGSVMDVAKAAAIEMTHPRKSFDYAYFQPRQPGTTTPPIVLLTTTSGTDSHVPKCSVVTHAEKQIKTGTVSDHIFAREAIRRLASGSSPRVGRSPDRDQGAGGQGDVPLLQRIPRSACSGFPWGGQHEKADKLPFYPRTGGGGSAPGRCPQTRNIEGRGGEQSLTDSRGPS